ncbi:MAG: hypothetical protein WCH39_11575 [Schlesneria sp.]
MERTAESPTSKYSKPTIGGIFSSSDHERFCTSSPALGFDAFFPEVVRDKTRNLYETGIDALAAILEEHTGPHGPITLWTAENFCRESLNRLSIKLGNRIRFETWPSQDDLLKLKPQDVLLYLHYNRFDPASKETINFIRQRTGATIIEDFVQAPLDIANFAGDYALNSLRKFSSVDVAVAYQNSRRQPSIEPTRYRILRKEAENAKTAFLQNPSEELEQLFLKLGRESDEVLAVPEIASAHEREVARAKAFDFKTVRQIRRSNYAMLAERIGAYLPEIEILPGEYMYLMVYVRERDRYRSDLFAQRVFPVIHWADSGCQHVKSQLSFHIDQRYTPADMERVVAVMTETQKQLTKTFTTSD